MVQTHRNRRRLRSCRGLAPLELVLWLPLLMFVAALMVNMGTMTTWRIRGEVVARDAVWRTRTPRTGATETRPAKANWPVSAKMAFDGDEQIVDLDMDEIRHEVVSGPHPSPNFQEVDVRETLRPDQGATRGLSAIERDYPLLAKLGPYRSGDIRHPLLDNKFQITEMEVPESELSSQETEVPPNIFRRIKIIYHLTETDPSFPMAFRDAVLDLLNMPGYDDLKVLDRDEEIRRYSGGYHDFHPRPRRICELDVDIVQEDAVDRWLVDYRDDDNDVRLGRISYLPRTMTNYFLSMYRGAKQRLEDQIEQMKSEGGHAAEIAAAQAEIDEMNPKIKQLEDFLSTLPEFEAEMRKGEHVAPSHHDSEDDFEDNLEDNDDVLEHELNDELDDELESGFEDDNEDPKDDSEDDDLDDEEDTEDE